MSHLYGFVYIRVETETSHFDSSVIIGPFVIHTLNINSKLILRFHSVFVYIHYIFGEKKKKTLL